MPYTIRFENDPNLATAAAQTVRISLPLDADLDLTTFRLGSFGFGGRVYNPPANRAFWSTRINARDSLGLYVDVNAGINLQAEQTLQTTLAAYQTNQTEFLMLLDAYRMLLMARLDYHMAVMKLMTARADLELAVGTDLDNLSLNKEGGQ